jgi:putative permease
MKPEERYPFIVRLALILVSTLAIGLILIYGRRLFSPLLFSFLFAVLLLPLANRMERRWKFSRNTASLISVILFLLGLFLVVFLIISQLTSLVSDWPMLKSQLTLLFYNIQLWALTHLKIDAAKQMNYINNATDNIMHSGTSLVGQTVLSLTSVLLFFVFIFLYTFFILFYRRLLVRFVTIAFSEDYTDVIKDIVQQVKHVIRGYIVGLFIEMAIVTTAAVSLFLVLGLKYAFLMGLMVGVFNIIPYVGIFSALVMSILVTVATSNPADAIYVAGSIIVIHLIDSNYLMPKVVGSHVKINPFIVIMGVVAGELIWGIPGMFLSIPYLAIAKVIFDRVEGLRAYGILMGEEEKTPAKTRRLGQWMNKRAKSKP